MPDWVRHTVRIGAFGPEMFRIPWDGGDARVIGIVPGQILTDSLVDAPAHRAGEALPDAERDLAKIAVVERHLGTGRVGLGFVRGFGLQRGALASSVAHDAHNVVVVGMNDASMAAAVRRLANRGGGIVVVDGAEVLAELPLPVAGPALGRAARDVLEASHAVIAAARELGCELEAPFQHLAFLALSVIPSLKLTDRGLVDVDRFELVPLEAAVILGNAWVRHLRRRGHRARAWLDPARGRPRRRGRRGRRARGRRGSRRRRRHAGPRQHPSPPVPDPDARTGAAGRPLHVAARRSIRPGRASTTRCSTPRRAPGIAELALSGCTTVFDHHYVFPRGVSGLVEAEIRAAQELGVRIVASRGSMDLGESDGGLPPDSLVESIDDILADTERLAGLADGDRVGIAVAPCSPFSVTTRLMEESAQLARRLGLQLHTHLAETVEEHAYCLELFGCTPVEYLERVGWVAEDVWCAHCVHLSDGDVQTFGSARRRRRPLPDLEPPPRCRRRAGARHA